MKSNVIKLPQLTIVKEDPFPNKVSLDELRRIWNDKHYTYTDDELMRIREWLYTVAAIAIRLTKEKTNGDNPGNNTIPAYTHKKAS